MQVIDIYDWLNDNQNQGYRIKNFDYEYMSNDHENFAIIQGS